MSKKTDILYIRKEKSDKETDSLKCVLTNVIDAVVDAVSILGEYLNEENWLQLLCNHLKYGL